MLDTLSIAHLLKLFALIIAYIKIYIDIVFIIKLCRLPYLAVISQNSDHKISTYSHVIGRILLSPSSLITKDVKANADGFRIFIKL